MSAQRRPTRNRIALRLLRYALWPIAQLRPNSGWARLYDRLCEMEGRKIDSRQIAQRRKVSPALTGFIVLLSAAAIVWISDVLRRPAPPPAACSAGTLVRAR